MNLNVVSSARPASRLAIGKLPTLFTVAALGGAALIGLAGAGAETKSRNEQSTAAMHETTAAKLRSLASAMPVPSLTYYIVGSTEERDRVLALSVESAADMEAYWPHSVWQYEVFIAATPEEEALVKHEVREARARWAPVDPAGFEVRDLRASAPGAYLSAMGPGWTMHNQRLEEDCQLVKTVCPD